MSNIKNTASIPEDLVVKFGCNIGKERLLIESKEEYNNHFFYLSRNTYLSMGQLKKVSEAIEEYIDLYNNRSVLTKRDGEEVVKKSFWRFWK